MPRVLVLVSMLALSSCGEEPALALVPVPDIPPAHDLDGEPGIVELELVASQGQVSLRGSGRTSVLGYRDGAGDIQLPGPLIEAKRGDTLRVHFRNELDEPTTVHWHGLRLPNDMDGNPGVSGVVMPGESFDYEFVLGDAGTYWYHPHVNTDEQMELGLSGPLVVHDPADPAVARERVLFIDDIELDDDDQIVLAPSLDDVMVGRRGNVLLVNGRPPGRIEVQPGAWERWRLINGANGRALRLSLDGLPLEVVAKDGGLVETPWTTTELTMAPGERYDLLVRFDGEAGQRFELRTLDVELGHAGLVDRELTLWWVELRGEPSNAAKPMFGRPLAPIIADPAAASTRALVLSDAQTAAGPLFYINDQAWPLNFPITVTQGDSEVWLVENRGEGPHPFHVHGLFFEVLDIDGQSRPARAREDTVNIGPGQTARIALQFTAAGAWMFHCQIPEHAERGMLGELMVSP